MWKSVDESTINHIKVCAFCVVSVCLSIAGDLDFSQRQRTREREREEKKKRKTKEKKKKWIYGGSDVAHIFVPLENQLNKHLSVAVLSIWLHSFHLIFVASACVRSVCVID